MERRTLGGKKKLTFAPKIPDIAEEERREEEEERREEKGKDREIEERRKEGRREEEKEDNTRSTVEGCAVARKKEIHPEDIEEREDMPKTLNEVKNRHSRYTDAVSREYFEEEKTYLLQLPKIYSGENSATIKGKLKITENKEILLTLLGKTEKNGPTKELTFHLTLSELSLLQQGFKKHASTSTYTNIGEIRRKLISSMYINEE